MFILKTITLVILLAEFGSISAQQSDVSLVKGQTDKKIPLVPGQKPCDNVRTSATKTLFRSYFCQKIANGKCQAPEDGVKRVSEVGFRTNLCVNFTATPKTSFRLMVIGSNGQATTLLDSPVPNGSVDTCNQDYVVRVWSKLDPSGAEQTNSVVQMFLYNSDNVNDKIVCVQSRFDAVMVN